MYWLRGGKERGKGGRGVKRRCGEMNKAIAKLKRGVGKCRGEHRSKREKEFVQEKGRMTICRSSKNVMSCRGAQSSRKIKCRQLANIIHTSRGEK
jgi:hypothetical protein